MLLQQLQQFDSLKLTISTSTRTHIPTSTHTYTHNGDPWPHCSQLQKLSDGVPPVSSQGFAHRKLRQAFLVPIITLTCAKQHQIKPAAFPLRARNLPRARTLVSASAQTGVF
ncbi:hypothetical protein PoB_005648400 [Plakobranchus ocellatus]|uniref:Uncharacterized protein n=1 Tax=Plakobranchus ocellatus TaxID=259542 RepID=A0AAV4CFN3_9GAST|nr:hypothetical protein PoB_005648400 [Plakobranchus ocellatus]